MGKWSLLVIESPLNYQYTIYLVIKSALNYQYTIYGDGNQ